MISNHARLACLNAAFIVRKLDTLWRVIAFAITLSVVSASTGAAAEQKLIRISSQKKDGETQFFVENLQHADVTVTIDMDLKNLTPSAPVPFTTTVPPREKVAAFTVGPEDPKQDSSWSYTYYATWGSLRVEHDDTFMYQLPYPTGLSFPVSQGFHGKYSHTGGDCYSIDFKMPEGSPIHAARAGTVVGVKDDSNVGGSDKKYEWDANYILIKHSDGTLGHYVHLQKSGVKVKVGDEVQTGQLIGLSGNTGHSTGPHLHFAVFKAQTGKQRETIPVKFRTTPLMADVLLEGRSYRAF